MATMYTVQEAADYLNVSRKTIYKWIKDGSLKAQKLGKRLYRIDEFDLYTFIRPVTY
jgi:excisionase family DNA binding protein